MTKGVPHGSLGGPLVVALPGRRLAALAVVAAQLVEQPVPVTRNRSREDDGTAQLGKLTPRETGVESKDPHPSRNLTPASKVRATPSTKSGAQSSPTVGHEPQGRRHGAALDVSPKTAPHLRSFLHCHRDNHDGR
jgi:hypothetical protein